MRNSAISRGLVAILASAAFVWTLTLSVSPQLHERVHPDANQVGHTCAVTIIASGNYEHSIDGSFLSAPILLVQISRDSILPSQSVESTFLVARIFEHAPPLVA